jgi:hypothetical protein
MSLLTRMEVVWNGGLVMAGTWALRRGMLANESRLMPFKSVSREISVTLHV